MILVYFGKENLLDGNYYALTSITKFAFFSTLKVSIKLLITSLLPPRNCLWRVCCHRQMEGIAAVCVALAILPAPMAQRAFL